MIKHSNRKALLIIVGVVAIFFMARQYLVASESSGKPAVEGSLQALPSESLNGGDNLKRPDTHWHWHAPKAPFIGNQNISNFVIAKKLIYKIQLAHPHTIYCDCLYEGHEILIDSCGYQVQHDEMRARRLEWEHVVPAENFGRSFQEWREGSRVCGRNGKSFKGRKCAETNPHFNQIEGDLYNLWPEDGELNALRNDFSMSELTASEYDFGRCNAKIQDRKFEPEPKARGIVARVYFYLEGAYPGHGILSEKNIKLFEAWDAVYPVNEWECHRTRIIEDVQGNVNPIVKPRCISAGLWPKNLARNEKLAPPRPQSRSSASIRTPKRRVKQDVSP